MEFFLWFWLLDKRFLCNMKRPLLKHFAFLWIIPIIFHLCMVAFYLFYLYSFIKSFNNLEYIILLVTILKIISMICLFVMLVNLYNISKNQPEQNKDTFILNFVQIKVNSKENKEIYVYYEDYWMARKNLLNYNGILILLLSVFHIFWSFFYLYKRNTFKDIFNLGAKYVLYYEFINIFFCLPVGVLLVYAVIVKLTFIISSMCCISCVSSLSERCCKRNKGLSYTIDFSDIPELVPENF